MDSIFQFLFGWGTPASIATSQYKEMWDAFVSGSSLPESWWQGTIEGIKNQITNPPVLVETAVEKFFAAILWFLPSGGNFPPEFHTAAVYFGNALQSVAFMFPVDVMVYCLVLSLNVFMALWSFHIIRSGLNFLRGVNTERYGNHY